MISSKFVWVALPSIGMRVLLSFRLAVGITHLCIKELFSKLADFTSIVS